MQGVFVEKVLSVMLKEIKKALNLTQPKLAEALGVNVDRVKSLTSGKVAKLSPAETKSMVENLHVNPGWLVTGEGEMFQSPTEKTFSSDLAVLRKTTDAIAELAISDNRKRQVRDILFAVAAGKIDLIEQAFSAVSNAPEGFILVPRYDVTGSMGNGHVIHSEQIVDHLAFRAEWVRTELATSPSSLVLISAIGDSMEPTLRAHDLLLIDRSVLSVKQDAIYAFAVDGELRVKRIQRLFDGSLIIKSDNPEYTTENLTQQQVESINIIGRVVWSGRRM